MDSENKNKYDFLIQLLSEGDAMVCLDSRLPNVDVPVSHKSNAALSLVFNLNFKRPFDVQEDGIYATLAFGGRPYKCVIPFDAVWSIHDPESKKGQVWEESFPKDLELKIKANMKEVHSETESSLEQNFSPETSQLKILKEKGQSRPKRDRSHLRVIK
jgi:stringent starvation protein B